ncbi:MAG: sulfatase-like hydrolase/transferase [Kiritimatiellales bacterium]
MMKKNLTGLISPVCAGLFSVAGALTANAADEQPNVLFVIVDDLNDYISLLQDYPGVQTPNLDRFAQTAMTFTTATCSAPLCNPSRASFLSGIAPYRSGVYGNNDALTNSVPIMDSVLLPEQFLSNGYFTMYTGKIFHNGVGPERMAAMWDDSQGGTGTVTLPSVDPIPASIDHPAWFTYEAWTGPDSDFNDFQAMEICKARLQRTYDKPFFLAYGIHRPHNPWTAPERFFDLYPLDSLELPPVLANDLDDVPALGRQFASGAGDFQALKEAGFWKPVLQSYLACISAMDECLGGVLDALDESPYRDNTIVCLVADNGYHMGEKEMFGKNVLWEQSSHVLMMWRVPGMTASGSQCSATVSLLDLYPTFNELCGLSSVPQDLDGRSLVPLLESSQADWLRPSLTTREQDNYSIRSDQWRYIRYYDGTDELYDHAQDPYEWTNLVSNSEYSSVRDDLLPWLPNTDITIGYRQDNVGNSGTAAQTVVDIAADGSGVLDAGSVNYPGGETWGPAVAGRVDITYTDCSFSVGLGGGTFDNATNSASFGTRLGLSEFQAAQRGLGLRTGAELGVDGNEGFLVTFGTDRLPAGSELQVTAVSLAFFNESQNESVVILNNATDEHMTVLPDSGTDAKTIDVSSLKITVAAGHDLIDPDTVSAGAFTIMCGEPEQSTGWRLESISLTVARAPDIIIGYRQGNVGSSGTGARTAVSIDFDRSGILGEGSVNYPGNNDWGPAVDGSSGAEYIGNSFSVGLGGGTFDNATNSVSFGTRVGLSEFQAAKLGLGLRTGTALGVDTNEGFLVVFGTDGLPPGVRLKVTSVSLVLFSSSENESAVILNNETGDYITAAADETGSRIIDISSLNVEVDSGQSLVDPDSVSSGTLTIMNTTPTASTGWRLESISMTLTGTAIHPVKLSIAVNAGRIVVSSTNLNVGAGNTLQYKTGLNEASWSNVSTITGATATNWIVDATNRTFFRVKTAW